MQGKISLLGNAFQTTRFCLLSFLSFMDRFNQRLLTTTHHFMLRNFSLLVSLFGKHAQKSLLLWGFQRYLYCVLFQQLRKFWLVWQPVILEAHFFGDETVLGHILNPFQLTVICFAQFMVPLESLEGLQGLGSVFFFHGSFFVGFILGFPLEIFFVFVGGNLVVFF